MTITRKEITRRRVVMRRAGSNGASCEYSKRRFVGEDIHEYSAAELAAMEAGEFESPLRQNGGASTREEVKT